jgi:hypothetical protein
VGGLGVYLDSLVEGTSLGGSESIIPALMTLILATSDAKNRCWKRRMVVLAMIGAACLSQSVSAGESFGEQRAATRLLRLNLNFPPDTENPKNATDLLSRALQHENVFATESPSLSFHARLEAASEGNKVATGDYTKLWVSPANETVGKTSTKNEGGRFSPAWT